VSIQANIAHKLIEVSVGTLTFHPSGDTHQTVNVLNVSSDLQTLSTTKNTLTQKVIQFRLIGYLKNNRYYMKRTKYSPV